jgi:hypothetical protein
MCLNDTAKEVDIYFASAGLNAYLYKTSFNLLLVD